MQVSRSVPCCHIYPCRIRVYVAQICMPGSSSLSPRLPPLWCSGLREGLMDEAVPFGVHLRPRLYPDGGRRLLGWLGFLIMASSSFSIIDAGKAASSEVVSCLFGTYVLWMVGMVAMLLPVMFPNSPHAAWMDAFVVSSMMWLVVAAYEYPRLV